MPLKHVNIFLLRSIRLNQKGIIKKYRSCKEIKLQMLLQQNPGPEDITDSSERIRAYIHRTPVMKSSQLNDLSKASLYFKCENLQKAGSFKSRGAMNACLSLKKNKLLNGVATHSSGNHAQALARAASILNVPSYIVMPNNAPKVKVAAVAQYGGNISFCEPNLASREATLAKVVAETGATEIHPYNNFDIIAGQATACYELIEEMPSPDFILCPVGGGGLLSGTALCSKYFSSKTKVIACEPEGANDAWQSFNSGKLIPSTNPKTIADGLLTSLGSLTFPIIKAFVHDIIIVNEHQIVEAMKLVWERMKIIIEPSSAVAVAVALKEKHLFQNKQVGIIISGGNVDLQKLPWQ